MSVFLSDSKERSMIHYPTSANRSNTRNLWVQHQSLLFFIMKQVVRSIEQFTQSLKQRQVRIAIVSHFNKLALNLRAT